MATPSELLITARALAVDGWTAEAVRALQTAGVDVLLLKGPAVASWLYDGEPRAYIDADLLVAQPDVGRAERVLEALGYALRDPEGERELSSGPHARTWARPADGATIDLHHALPGEFPDATVAWPVLWPRAVRLLVAGTPVPVLDEPARALLVALHAWHHTGTGPPLEDLRRALERVPDRVWADAAALAEQLMALSKLVRGLRLLPAGRPLTERLGLPAPELLERLETEPLAGGFERLARRRGVRARAALARRALFPATGYMHWWLPWSRGGRSRLAAAYAYRFAWLAAHAGRGFRAWRRARTGAGG